jgi:parallel beta-helix repeat protein
VASGTSGDDCISVGSMSVICDNFIKDANKNGIVLNGSTSVCNGNFILASGDGISILGGSSSICNNFVGNYHTAISSASSVNNLIISNNIIYPLSVGTFGISMTSGGQNCIISDNHFHGGGGLYCNSAIVGVGSGSIVTNNSMHMCGANSSVCISTATNPINLFIAYNKIRNPHSTMTYGIQINSSTTITANVVIGNSIGAVGGLINHYGISMGSSTFSICSENVVFGNNGVSSEGAIVGIGANTICSGNIIYDANGSGIVAIGNNSIINNNNVHLSGAAGDRYGIILTGSSGCIIGGNNLYYGKGIYLNVQKSNVFNNCINSATAEYGIYFTSCSNNNIIGNSVYGESLGRGIRFASSSSYNIVANNVIDSTVEHGIFFSSGVSNNISNNYMCNTGLYGISLSGAADSIISGNHLYNDNGIYLNNITKSNISNNLISPKAAEYGINLYGTSEDNNVFGNYIYCNSSAYGINIESGSRNKISCNVVYYSAQYGIVCRGGNYNIVTENYIYRPYVYGIYFYNLSLNAKVSNNYIYLYDGVPFVDCAGICFESCRTAQITSNNIVMEDTTDLGLRKGISIDTCSYLSISGNYIYNYILYSTGSVSLINVVSSHTSTIDFNYNFCYNQLNATCILLQDCYKMSVIGNYLSSFGEYGIVVLAATDKSDFIISNNNLFGGTSTVYGISISDTNIKKVNISCNSVNVSTLGDGIDIGVSTGRKILCSSNMVTVGSVVGRKSINYSGSGIRVIGNVCTGGDNPAFWGTTYDNAIVEGVLISCILNVYEA